MQNVRIEFTPNEIELLIKAMINAEVFSSELRTPEFRELSFKFTRAKNLSQDSDWSSLYANEGLTLCPASIPKRGGATSDDNNKLKPIFCSYCNEQLDSSNVAHAMARCHYACALQAGDVHFSDDNYSE